MLENFKIKRDSGVFVLNWITCYDIESQMQLMLDFWHMDSFKEACDHYNAHMCNMPISYANYLLRLFVDKHRKYPVQRNLGQIPEGDDSFWLSPAFQWWLCIIHIYVYLHNAYVILFLLLLSFPFVNLSWLLSVPVTC